MKTIMLGYLGLALALCAYLFIVVPGEAERCASSDPLLMLAQAEAVFYAVTVTASAAWSWAG